MSGSTYVVTNESQLNSAISAIDAASVTAPAGSAYVIDVTSDLTLGANITAIDLAAGSSLLITGSTVPFGGNPTAVIDGDTLHRGFVVQAGAVTFDSLNLINMLAAGGRGGNGAQPGGGGAGLGGAVFVGAAAAVTLSNDTFTGNAATGGQGGSKTGTGIGAGGGGDPGGFGAGGAGGVAGGFGGGGGYGATGGFGAGSNAGGGLAAGGNIFVAQGGTLNFASGSTGGGTLNPGAPGGQAYGNNIFIQGNTTITLGNVTLAGVIADQGGAGGAGAVSIQGTATLSGANTYSGGTLINGSLTLLSTHAAGTGEISFVSGSLIIGAGDAPANLIGGFTTGETIDIKGIGLAKTAILSAGNALTLAGGTGSPVTLNFDPAQNYASDTFVLRTDSAKGTLLTVTQTQFTVSNETDLNTVLAEIDAGGTYAVPNLAYTITFAAGFTLGTDLNAINLSSGDKLTINGAGNTLDGGGLYRGFFVYGGNVELDNLTIQNAVAAGGAGGAGVNPGGGGAGLGGGLFVAAGAAATLNNVNFLADSAIGGNGGAVASGSYGGGGGLGGAGGAGSGRAAGGGGVGTGAVGGTYGGAGPGAGILLGAGGANGGTGQNGGTAGAANGGGGGPAGQFSGSGRDPRSYPGTAGAGGAAGNGNFGGGAGSGQLAGFGGGGAVPNGASGGAASGPGGWGGGGAGANAGGFGAGAGIAGGAGGGLGAGGAVFVQQGGSLTINGGSLSGGTATGGTGSGGGANGAAYGSGIFFQGNNQLTFAPTAAQTISIGNVIADTQGAAAVAGQVSLLLNGAGTVTLLATNNYSDGTTIDAGTLSLQAPGAAGSGGINFGYGATASLVVGNGDIPTNVISEFLPGDVIDLQGIGTATSASLGAGDVLQITGGTTNVNLNLSTLQNFTGETFSVHTDNTGGSYVIANTTGNDHPPFISGAAINGNDHASFAPLKGVTIQDLDSAQIETATLQLSSTANGHLGNLGTGSYNAATGVYTVSGTAAAVTAAIDKLTIVPVNHEVAPGSAVTTGFNLSVTDGTMIASAAYNVAVRALNDAPVISGGGTQVNEYWNVAFKPFTAMKITDPDKAALETTTLTVSSPSNGTFSLAAPVNGVSLTEISAGVYTLSAASPANETAALHAVKFTPTTTNPAAGFTITSLGVSVSDGIAPAVTAPGITVYAGLPITTGTVAGQTVVDTATIAPFSAVKITDSAYFTSESVTITLTDSNGIPTDANGLLSGAGLTKVGTGVYSLANGTPAAVTKALDALVFTPTPNQVPAGQSVTSNFELSVFDGATTANNYNTSVIASAPAAAAIAPLSLASIGQPKIGFLQPAASIVASARDAGVTTSWTHWLAEDPLPASEANAGGTRDISVNNQSFGPSISAAEPPRDSRRLFDLSYAAISVASCIA
jgi:hypothetical protein